MRFRTTLRMAAVLLFAAATFVLPVSQASAEPCSVNAGHWFKIPNSPVIGEAVSPWYNAGTTLTGGPRKIRFVAKSGWKYEKQNGACQIVARKGFMYNSSHQVTECAKQGPVGPVGCTVSKWLTAPMKGCPPLTNSVIERFSRSGCNGYTRVLQAWNGGGPL